MEKRVAKRIICRVKALFGPEAPKAAGFALNVSAEGLYLSATRVLPPRTELQIRLEPIGSPAVEVRGKVRWAQRVPQGLVSIVKPGMGVRLHAPPREYLDLFAHLVKLSPQRANPRAEAHLEVRFYSRDLLVKEYTENISQGGLFIATGEPFEPGDEIVVDLMIPDLAAVWQVGGRVAYRLDAERARQLESLPGIGIQITRMDEAVRTAFHDYVQKLLRLYDLEA